MVDSAFFFQRLNDHIQYLKKIQGAIEDKNSFKGTDPHHCKLGEWLYGTGPEEAAAISDLARDIFDELFEPHEEFHQASSRALEKHAAGDDSGCTEEMTQMHILSGTLVNILIKLDDLSR
ncbi:CZB domain-containing protein [Thiolapillus brandeum]|uniref:Methyl-accepting chemotaxis protein n=1 Tax=Thiolapillus brandeum TaxID=1076588 RepID=A0A7U6GL80_9GAMM|nr:CZB domain-containing protein [Thiolapillus brandeum]BAO45716.1 methyl-accepting chemotaxis protein [Thiolapillus brandeum]